MNNQTNETFANLMKKLLADSFAFYLKAANYHWNVTGRDFIQYHDFFGQLYAEVYASIDITAEEIRTLDTFVPGSFTRFSELTEIEDELNVPDAMSMIRRLSEDNQKILKTLDLCYRLSEQMGKFGLTDYLAGRIDAHQKHQWMLNSFLK